MGKNSNRITEKYLGLSQFWMALILLTFSSVLFTACFDVGSGSPVASNNTVVTCPLTIISCNSVKIVINVLPLHLHITDGGTTVCDGNMKVNGVEANRSQDTKLGTTIIYKGSGGKLEANSNTVYCFNFVPATPQSVINTFVSKLGDVLKLSGCGNKPCIDGVKSFTFGH
jgi:hypothetical protein